MRFSNGSERAIISPEPVLVGIAVLLVLVIGVAVLGLMLLPDLHRILHSAGTQ